LAAAVTKSAPPLAIAAMADATLPPLVIPLSQPAPLRPAARLQQAAAGNSGAPHRPQPSAISPSQFGTRTAGSGSPAKGPAIAPQSPPMGPPGGVPLNMARPLSDALARAVSRPPGTNGTLGSTPMPEDPAAKGRSATGAPPPLPLAGPASGSPSGSGQLTPDFSSLPPGVAASLARLAGVKPLGEAKTDESPKGGTG
jgi:hypothetical protein